MKKSIKISIILIILGALLSKIAIFLGAETTTDLGKLNIGVSSIYNKSVKPRSNDLDRLIGKEIKSKSGSTISGSIKKGELDLGKVNKANIKLDSYKILVEPSKDEKANIEYTYLEKDGKIVYGIDISEKDGHLEINKKGPDNSKIFKNKDDGKFIIIMKLPKNIELTTGINSGAIFIDNMKFQGLSLESDLGDIEIEDSKLVNGNISSGIGSIDIKDSTSESTSIESEIGSVEYSGKLIGINNFKTELGSIEIDLDQKREEVGIYTDIGLGKIDIKGFKGQIKDDKGNFSNFLNISSENGSVEVDFLDSL